MTLSSSNLMESNEPQKNSSVLKALNVKQSRPYNWFDLVQVRRENRKHSKSSFVIYGSVIKLQHRKHQKGIFVHLINRMKKILTFIIILTLIGCSNEQNKISTSTEEKAQIFDDIKPPKLFYVNFSDENCQIQIDNAKKEVKREKYKFIDPLDIGMIRYDDEMEELLANYKIEYSPSGPNCTLEQECYAYYMDSIIQVKFGSKFISSIREKSDSLFLSKWKTKDYMYWNIDEIPSYSKYPAGEFISERLNFSNGWDTIPIKFQRQYLTLEMLISNEGKLKEWKFDDQYNVKKTNLHLIPDLKDQISEVVNKMDEWNPGILSSKRVNCRLLLDVNLDQE